MRVTSTQFSLAALAHEVEFWAGVERLIEDALRENSEVILFPEYFSLSWVLKRLKEPVFQRNLERCSEVTDEFIERFQTLCQTSQLALVAGTLPVVENGKILNRCYVFRPDQSPLYQDKINKTRFEDEVWKMHSGAPQLQTFDWKGVSCAVTICYDVEFPSVCAQAAEERVEVLFVPSCTEDHHGYWRVRHCAQARCIENQCFVVMASIVDGNQERPEIDKHYGQAGIFTPCDRGLPEGGVLALGEVNQVGSVTALLDLPQLQEIRQNGTVLNLRDHHRRHNKFIE